MVVPSSAAAVFRRTARLLERNGVPEPRESAAYLLSAATRGRCSDAIRFDPQAPGATHHLSAGERRRFAAMVRRRSAREPVQYIIGEWDFRDLTLAVRPPCLIPRAETEDLVDWVVADPTPIPRHFLDVGCGSGALSISLLKEWPRACAVAIDVDPECVSLTVENAQMHGVLDRLRVVNACVSDTGALGAHRPRNGFDLIVSNPPYIATDLWATALPPEVKEWESRQALDGGTDGLDVVRLLLSAATPHGSPQRVGGLLREAQGRIWMELDVDQPTALRDMMKAAAAGTVEWWATPSVAAMSRDSASAANTAVQGDSGRGKAVGRLEVAQVAKDFTSRVRFCKLHFV